MPDSSTRIARNSLVLLVGESAARLLSAAYQVLLARYLGAGLFGEFSYALALAMILGILSDLGLTSLVLREIARPRDDPGTLLVRAGWTRAALAILLGALATLLTLLTDRPRRVAELVGILALMQLVQGQAELLASAHRGRERVLLPTAVALATRAGLALTGIGIMALGATVETFALLALLWAVPGAILLRFRLPFPAPLFRAAPRLSQVTAVLRKALPIGLGILFWTVYFRMDMVVLGWLRGEVEVGRYAAPFRMVEAVLFLPAPFLVSMMPLLSRRPPGDPEARSVLLQTMRTLGVLGGPFAAVLVAFSPGLLGLLFGPAFLASASSLVCLALTIPASFAAAPVLSLLIAENREREYARLMAAGAAGNLLLDLLLIPPLGALGAALATAVTEALVLALALRRAGVPGAIPVLLAVTVPWLSLLALLLATGAAGLSPGIRLAAGMLVVYPLLAFATGALRRGDPRFILGVLGIARR